MSRVLRRLLAVLVLAILLAPMAAANSAEPPGLTVVVDGGPADLQLQLEIPYSITGDEIRVVEPQLETRLWERQFHFFDRWSGSSDKVLDHAVLAVTSGDETFTCPVPADSLKGYNNLLTLDYKNQVLEGKYDTLRIPLLVLLRVVLTLMLEGIVFFLAGYRQKRSWLIFLIVNLVTQGVLNATLQGPFQFYNHFIRLIFGEFLIFIVELCVYCGTIKEKCWQLSAFTAFAANLLSLFAGGWALLHFPL